MKIAYLIKDEKDLDAFIEMYKDKMNKFYSDVNYVDVFYHLYEKIKDDGIYFYIDDNEYYGYNRVKFDVEPGWNVVDFKVELRKRKLEMLNNL